MCAIIKSFCVFILLNLTFIFFEDKVVIAQFGDLMDNNHYQDIIDIDPLNNMAVLSLIKSINTDGTHISGKILRSKYVYEMKDFTDNTDWISILNFRSSGLSQLNNNKWNKILKIKITLIGKRGIIIPSEIIDTIQELHYSLSPDNNGTYLLRMMEIALKDINITLPLVPEQPPEYIGGVGLMGVANLKTYDAGKIEIETTNGNFILKLSFPLKIMSDGSKLEYPICDYGLAIVLDDIIHHKTGKHLPKDVFEIWSGIADMKKKSKELDSLRFEPIKAEE